ncbi:MAG TPA: hypothetical protein VGJ56_22510, partial [Reyranella sp.]
TRSERMPNTPDSPNGAAPGRPKVVRDGQKRSDRQTPDYGALTVEALKRHTNSQEFSARYKAWLEYVGPELWSPIAKADYETMCKEDISPELVARYRAELEARRVSPSELQAGRLSDDPDER